MNSTRASTGLPILVAVLVVACGTTAGVADPAPSAPPDGVVIVASGMAFDRAEVTIPADRAFPLLFENRDGAPHNVTVLDSSSGQPVLAGEVFGGHDSRTYQVPALNPGRYPFRCDVHPDMAGTLIANGPSPAPAPS
jgi:plastocyanin